MIDSLYPLISNIDELVAVFVADENGKIIQSSQKHGLFSDFEKVINGINYSFSLSNNPILLKKKEIIIFFEKGTIYLKSLPAKQVYLILNTPKPSAFSCFAIKDLLKKLESQTLEKGYKAAPDDSSALRPLSIFQPIIEVLSKHYGPAAKLIVKKALKQSNATSDGIARSMLGYFEQMLENEIMDVHLRPKIMQEVKEILKNYS